MLQMFGTVFLILSLKQNFPVLKLILDVFINNPITILS